MNAQDLMIGDWVYNKYIDKPMQVYPMMFSQMFRSHPDATTEDYNIFPIPLTPEILKKNGWKQDFDEVYVWKDGAAHYISIDLDGKTRIYVATLYIFGMALGYVHELQHALRLCGIEKEIEL